MVVGARHKGMNEWEMMAMDGSDGEWRGEKDETGAEIDAARRSFRTDGCRSPGNRHDNGKNDHRKR